MRWTASVAIAGLTVLGGGVACRPKPPAHGIVGSEPQKDWGILEVGLNDAGNCVLKKKNGVIRTDANSQVAWIVMGSCSAIEGQHTIEIEKTVKGTKDYDPFKNSSVLSRPIPPLGTPFELLIGDITETVTENDKGKYRYKIKIKKNGQESLDGQAAAEDEFRLCPVWPCE